MSATNDLTRLCALMVDGRPDGQVVHEYSWHRSANSCGYGAVTDTCTIHVPCLRAVGEVLAADDGDDDGN